MIIVKPETVDDSVLTSSISEPDISFGEIEWSAFRRTEYSGLDGIAGANGLSEYRDLVFVGNGTDANKVYTYTLNNDYTTTAAELFTLNAATGTVRSIAYSRLSDKFAVLDTAGLLTFYNGDGTYIDSKTDAEIPPTTNAALCAYQDGFIYAKVINSVEVKYYMCSGFSSSGFAIAGNYTATIFGDNYNLYRISTSNGLFITVGDLEVTGNTVTETNYCPLFEVAAQLDNLAGDTNPVFSNYENKVYLSGVRYLSSLSATDSSFNIGDIATVISAHTTYQCAANNNFDRPDIGAAKEVPTWIKYAPTNKYAMFDGSTSNQSISDSGTVTTTLTYPGAITSISGFNLDNVSTVAITISGGTAHTETVTMGDDKTFSRFGLNGTTVTLVFTPSASPMKIGQIACGEERLLGEANFGGSVGLLDFSRVENDTFGNTTITPRRKVKLIDYDVTVDTDDVEETFNFISSITTVPSVYAAESEFTGQALVAFAIYQDFRAVIEAPEVSTYTLSVQGLT